MPVHDWKPGFAWLFHDFRANWLSALSRRLNSGLLPPGHYALIERAEGDAGGDERLPGSNVVTVRRGHDDRPAATCEVAAPDYHSGGIDGPAIARRVAGLLTRGVNVLLVNLHRMPPTHRHSLHALIWNEVGGDEFAPPADKPLTLASYEAAVPPMAYVEPVAAGDALPDMPLFLVPGGHVLVPLEATYQAAWEGVPVQARRAMAAEPG